MSYQLNLDQMLEAAQRSKLPQASDFVREAESLAAKLAALLADHLKIETEDSFTTFQPGFGGLCAPFWPVDDEQPLPDALEGFDNEEEWQSRATHDAEMQKIVEAHR